MKLAQTTTKNQFGRVSQCKRKKKSTFLLVLAVANPEWRGGIYTIGGKRWGRRKRGKKGRFHTKLKKGFTAKGGKKRKGGGSVNKLISKREGPVTKAYMARVKTNQSEETSWRERDDFNLKFASRKRRDQGSTMHCGKQKQKKGKRL